MNYGMSVDVWSAGCIIAEMHKRDPLMMGDSEIDQLHKIFKLFGTPNDHTWTGVTGMKEWRNNFPMWKGNKLQETLHKMDPLGIDLLNKMLILDPKRRITIEDALNHPWLKDV